MAGSYLYIWFVFYVSLPNEIKLLLFNIFFFAHTSRCFRVQKLCFCKLTLENLEVDVAGRILNCTFSYFILQKLINNE